MMIWAKKKSPHFQEKYLVLSYLTWENTLSDYGSVAGHRNLNETERSAIARYRNFNAPKICKVTVYQPSNVTLADLGASISELTQRNLDLLKRPRESLQVFQNYIPTYDNGQTSSQNHKFRSVMNFFQKILFNPIQGRLFWSSGGQGGGGAQSAPLVKTLFPFSESTQVKFFWKLVQNWVLWANLVSMATMVMVLSFQIFD